MNVHPHPGPLPQEREKRLLHRGEASARTDLASFPKNDTHSPTATPTNHFPTDVAMLLPLLGGEGRGEGERDLDFRPEPQSAFSLSRDFTPSASHTETNAHPHPGPLPQERENRLTHRGEACARTDPASFPKNDTHSPTATPTNHFPTDVNLPHPLLGGEGRGEGERDLDFHSADAPRRSISATWLRYPSVEWLNDSAHSKSPTDFHSAAACCGVLRRRGAPSDRSPWRQPWVLGCSSRKPRSGDRKFATRRTPPALSPLTGLTFCSTPSPRLAPWATVWRRSAANLK